MQVTISGAQEPSNANQYKKRTLDFVNLNRQDTKIYNLMKKQKTNLQHVIIIKYVCICISASVYMSCFVRTIDWI